MKAVTWHGKRDVRVDEVPDPHIQYPTDAVVKITSTAICGSDLHLYEVMGPFMGEGNILGHEPMGIVQEVGSEVKNIAPGDRVVIPFQIACGHCFMCGEGLQTQCETTQVREEGMGAALFGYIELLEAAGLHDGYTSSADVESTKPEPDLIEVALKKAGTGSAVMVGDSVWDVEAARRAGLDTIGVLCGGFGEAELAGAGASPVVESIDQVAAAILPSV